MFPTLNDESSRMTCITFGIIIFLLAVLGYFVFDASLIRAAIGVAIAVLVILFGIYKSPEGWITIEKTNLNIYGLQERIDTRQLKEITIKNDKIVLTNIYGGNANSYNLKLNPIVSQTIKKFLEEKLQENKIQVIDQVTDAV